MIRNMGTDRVYWDIAKHDYPGLRPSTFHNYQMDEIELGSRVAYHWDAQRCEGLWLYLMDLLGLIE